MSVGPIRRLVGLLGLVALAPTAAMLVTARISPTDAALRAVATLLATMLVGRLASWWVGRVARGLDASAEAGVQPLPGAAMRRVSDAPAG